MTFSPRSIVVAVDFGEASARAVTLAGAFAERCGATLTLLHAEAFDAPPYFTPEQIGMLQADVRKLRSRARDALASFGREHTSHPFTVEVELEPAVEAILKASRGVDLVVMGTHGRRGPSRWWLGSVAERVLRATTTALLVVHAGPPASGSALLDALAVHATALPPTAEWLTTIGEPLVRSGSRPVLFVPEAVEGEPA